MISLIIKYDCGEKHEAGNDENLPANAHRAGEIDCDCGRCIVWQYESFIQE